MHRTRDWRRDQKARRNAAAYRLYEARRANHDKTWWHFIFRYSHILRRQGDLEKWYNARYGDAYWDSQLRYYMSDEGRHWWQREHHNRRCYDCSPSGACEWCIGGRYSKHIRMCEAMDEELRCYLMGELFCEEEESDYVPVDRMRPTRIAGKRTRFSN